MRVKSRWNRKDRPHSSEEVASALAFNIWRIACNGVLNLENENFQTDSQSQRLDAIAEFVAFLLHVSVRWAYANETEEGSAVIASLGQRLVELLHDNAKDIHGEGDYRALFADRLNERQAAYAETSFVDGEPGFSMLRFFGDSIAAVMGPRDNRWIMDQIMEIEAPDAVKTLRRAVRGLLPEFTPAPDAG